MQRMVNTQCADGACGLIPTEGMSGARIIEGRPFRGRLWLLCEAVNQANRKEHPDE